MAEISNPTSCLPVVETMDQLSFSQTSLLKDFVTNMGYSSNSEAEKLIEQSKHILMLREGWDEEDALPVDKVIWENATSFLKAYVRYFDRKYLTALELPEINPVRDGSIDLEWRTSKGRLLINFNHRNLQKASFYGDRYADEDRIKGEISIKGVTAHFALWMKNCL